MTRHAWIGIVFVLMVGLLGLGRNGFGGRHLMATTIAGTVILLGLFVLMRAGRTRV